MVLKDLNKEELKKLKQDLKDTREFINNMKCPKHMDKEEFKRRNGLCNEVLNQLEEKIKNV